MFEFKQCCRIRSSVLVLELRDMRIIISILAQVDLNCFDIEI